MKLFWEYLGENLEKSHLGAGSSGNLLRRCDSRADGRKYARLDGFELAHMIRQHPRFQKTAIIFISGVHLDESDTINGYRRGAVDYISVPVVPEVLRAKISVFVELHRKTRLLERLNNSWNSGRRAHRGAQTERIPVPHACQQYSSTRMDGESRRRSVLVQPTLVRFHRVSHG